MNEEESLSAADKRQRSILTGLYSNSLHVAFATLSANKRTQVNQAAQSHLLCTVPVCPCVFPLACLLWPLALSGNVIEVECKSVCTRTGAFNTDMHAHVLL